MIELTHDTFADRPEVARHEHGLIVFGQVFAGQETFFARRDPPAQEDLAQPDKENDVHQVLDGEGIEEMLRGLVQDQDGRASGKNQRKKRDKNDRGRNRHQNRVRAFRLGPERVESRHRRGRRSVQIEITDAIHG